MIKTIWIWIFYRWKNPTFDKYIRNFGLSNDNLEFLDFIQSDFCKEILESNDLKIHIETGIKILR